MELRSGRTSWNADILKNKIDHMNVILRANIDYIRQSKIVFSKFLIVKRLNILLANKTLRISASQRQLCIHKLWVIMNKLVKFIRACQTIRFPEPRPACLICYENFEPGQRVNKCNHAHYFHHECLQPIQAPESHIACPYCNNCTIYRSLYSFVPDVVE